MSEALLLEKAQSAAEKAYAPYSNYPVGACVMTESGELFTGCNVENGSYSATVCAERVAIFKAISHGARVVTALALFTENRALPCGTCLQVLSEFARDGEILIYAGSPTGSVSYRLSELLPHAFQFKPKP
ncbi:MAG: cytidine deaminase [Armatimonadetes bacterium]|nr:cytidine deaminase [Armatimonadota bacterium]